MGKEISRREFLKLANTAALSAVILPHIDFPGVSAIQAPQMGDVFRVGREAFLLRNNKSYLIPDLEKYLRYTKFDRYGRHGVVEANPGIFDQYPPQRLVANPKELGTLDPLTGEWKDTKPLGGEMMDYYSGIFTEEGIPYNPTIPAVDTFKALRRDLSERKGFSERDSFFYTHGVEKLDRFTPHDTVRPVPENIEFALKRAVSIKEEFPLIQLNVVAHSLGCIMALEVAREHPDLINNLILINGPVRGISWNILRGGLRRVVQPLIRPFIGEEYVTDYLFKRWEDKAFQRGLDDFARIFTGMGRRLVVVIAENDPIVPKESALLPGALLVTLTVGDPRLNITDYPREHSLPLKHKESIKTINDEVGDNLVVS